MPPDHRSKEAFMKRVLVLARRGEGRVSPNPMVGAVIVRAGQVVGEGYHLYAQRDHAEIVALRRAGKQARGADLYINLEPCSHEGRTPPCADEVIQAGIGRVFVGHLDPNPQVSGRGVARLREAGIKVEVGLLEELALRLNEVFLHFITSRMPFVTLKLAQTLDGKIAAGSGESKWITGEKARKRVHHMRYRNDGILVGVETVLLDNPSLDVRWRRSNRITKVILDSRLRTPSSARLFDSGDRVIIFHTESEPPRKYPQHAELIQVPAKQGRVRWDAVCECLGERQVTSLLVEGGSRVAASALQARIIQKVALFYSPKILGSSGISSVADLGVESLDESIKLHDLSLRRLGDDFLVEAYINSFGEGS